MRALAELIEQVEQLIAEFNQTFVEVSSDLIGQRPVGEISPDAPLVRLAMSCLEAQGLQPKLNIGSTDANIPLSRGLPAICIGLTTGGGAHTAGEYILTQPLDQGFRAWVEEVLGLKVRGDHMQLNPVIPGCWEGFHLRYRHGEAIYEIQVKIRKAASEVCRGWKWTFSACGMG